MRKAVLVDVDGTQALRGDGPGVREFWDWHRVGEDLPNWPIIELVRILSMRYTIIDLSGRDEICRPETKEWLNHYMIPWDVLFMRAHKDNRKDAVVKRELYERHIKGQLEVEFVLDDRDQVVQMWRHELGLTCLQVAEGVF